jgi:hypothetical protein
LKTIPLLSDHGETLVDDKDFEWLNQWNWSWGKGGYAVRTFNSKPTIYMHRLILGCPPQMECDHIDGNRLNNQRINLRICTHRQNSLNRAREYNNVSGYKGVYYCNGKYIQARIRNHDKDIYIGTFPDLISAAKAYDKKATELWGEYARLNFPEDKSHE